MGKEKVQRKNSRKKQKTSLKKICIVLIVSIILFGGWQFGRTTIPHYQENTPKGAYKQKIRDEHTVNNSIIKKDAAKDISARTNWNLLLVNQWNKLPLDYTVELYTLENGHSIDKRAYPSLEAMLEAADAQGLSPIICSSYRTQQKQQSLFDNQVNNNILSGYSKDRAEKEAQKWVALPGTSEHQTGLAVDIVAQSYQHLNEKQAETAEQQWLMENSYKYGFILRYNSDKSHITGIEYEPWHYRYVGIDAAKEIYTRKISLEEYVSS